VQLETLGVAMSLERRVLARVDRRLLSDMDHTDGTQLVKVPVSDAVWSTWRRYCDAVGLSMGRGLAVLLNHELASLVDEDVEGLSERLREREAGIAAREAEFTERHEELTRREDQVTVAERRLAKEANASQTNTQLLTPPPRGRNEPCWCGSGKKFKYCHGRPT
jgi:hypothetical protein